MAQRRPRRRFTREYKAQAVQRLIERGRPLADIAVCGPAAGLGRASHSRGPAPGGAPSGAPSGATPDRAADARHGFASPTGSATPAPNPRQPPRSAHRPQSAGSLLGGRASRHRVARRPLRDTVGEVRRPFSLEVMLEVIHEPASGTDCRDPGRDCARCPRGLPQGHHCHPAARRVQRPLPGPGLRQALPPPWDSPASPHGGLPWSRSCSSWSTSATGRPPRPCAPASTGNTRSASS